MRGLLDLSEVDQVRVWKQRIDWCEEKMERHVNEWRENSSLLQGRVNSSKELIDSLISSRRMDDDAQKYIYVNVFYAIARSMFPSIYFSDPVWKGKPKRPADWKLAPLWGEILNDRMQGLEIGELSEQVVLDALCCSRGIIKSGWLLNLQELATKDVESFVEVDDHNSTSITIAHAEGPLAKRVSPVNFLYDFTKSNYRESPWLIERVWKRPEDIRNDPNYRHTKKLLPDGRIDVGQLTPSERTSSKRLGTSDRLDRSLSDEEYDDANMYAFYEIHDRQNGKIFVVSKSCDKYHRNQAYPYDHPYLRRESPYTVLSLTVSVPDEPNPLPVFSAIRDLVLEKSDIRTLRLEYQRRSLPRMGVWKAGLDDEDWDNLEDNKLGQFVPTSQNPSEVLRPISWPNLNTDVTINENQIDRDIQETTGSTSASRGFSTGVTATESSIIDQRLAGVESDARRRIRQFLRKVGKKVLALEREFMPDDEVRSVMVTGRVGLRKLVDPSGPPFASFKKRDIPDDFDIDIDVEAMMPSNPEIRRKQSMDLLNILAQFSDLNPINIQTGMARVDGSELLRMVVEAFPAVDVESLIPSLTQDRPAQDPREEWAAFVSGVKPTVSQFDQHQKHLIAHQRDWQAALESGYQPSVNEEREWLEHVQEHDLAYESFVAHQTATAPGGGAGGGGDPGQPPNSVSAADPAALNRSTPSVAGLLSSITRRGGGSGI